MRAFSLLLFTVSLSCLAQQTDWVTQIRNKPFADARQYLFTRTPGGSLSVGANTVTLSPVPLGVNGTDANHWLYISGGTGTAEAVLITGGTATSAATTGTVIFTAAYTHSGSWTIASATSGGQEAAIANPGGTVLFAVGTWPFYAPLTLVPSTTASAVLCSSPYAILQAQTGTTNVINIFGTSPGSVSGCTITDLVTGTSNVGIQLGNGVTQSLSGNVIRDNIITQVYDGIYVASGGDDLISENQITAQRYDVHLTNLVNIDNGDDMVQNNQLQLATYGSGIPIYIHNLGGFQIINNTIVANGIYCIDMEGEFYEGEIADNHCTAWTSQGIRLNSTGAAGSVNIQVVDNQTISDSCVACTYGIYANGSSMGSELELLQISGNITQGFGIQVTGYIQFLQIQNNQVPTVNTTAISASGLLIANGAYLTIEDNLISGSLPYTATNYVMIRDLSFQTINVSQLPSAAAPGSEIFASDGLLGSNPCTGSSSGAMATRTASGTWSCASTGGGGGGMTWPGSAGIAVYSGYSSWSSPATFSTVVGLWASGACSSGYLKYDGTCSTPGGGGGGLGSSACSTPTVSGGSVSPVFTSTSNCASFSITGLTTVTPTIPSGYSGPFTYLVTNSTPTGSPLTYAGTSEVGLCQPDASTAGAVTVITLLQVGSTLYPLSCVGASSPTLASGSLLASQGATGPSVAATAHNLAIVRACADSSGSATAQSCATVQSFVPAAGDQIIYTTTTQNSGALTVNVNSSGAAGVYKWAGSTTLASGDIPANRPITMTYDASGHWDVDDIGNVPAGGGGSLTDACGSGYGHWEPFGPPQSFVSITMTANTVYAFEAPANSPLCTIDNLTVVTNGSGNVQVSLWNAAMTSVVATTTVTTMNAYSSGQALALSSAFQLQANTTYIIAITGAHTGDQFWVTVGNNSLYSNGMGSYPRTFTCANSAAWAGSNPNLPASCGMRTGLPNGPIAVLGFHS